MQTAQCRPPTVSPAIALHHHDQSDWLQVCQYQSHMRLRKTHLPPPNAQHRQGHLPHVWAHTGNQTTTCTVGTLPNEYIQDASLLSNRHRSQCHQRYHRCHSPHHSSTRAAAMLLLDNSHRFTLAHHTQTFGPSNKSPSNASKHSNPLHLRNGDFVVSLSNQPNTPSNLSSLGLVHPIWEPIANLA